MKILTVVESCAGTFADTDARTFTDSIEMVEYGSEEALSDASGVVDLSNKVIMVDTGVLELRDGMTYNLDGAIIMQTGYETIYNLGQWYSEEPYGTVIEMDGGSVNVLTPEFVWTTCWFVNRWKVVDYRLSCWIHYQ